MAFNINKSGEEVKSSFDISKGGDKPSAAGKDSEAPKSKLIWIIGIGILIAGGLWFFAGESEPKSAQLAEVSNDPATSQTDEASGENIQQLSSENSESNDSDETTAINSDIEEGSIAISPNGVAATNAATSNNSTEAAQNEPQIPEIPALNFAKSGTSLRQNSNELNEFIQYLKSNDSQSLEIIGYASSEGNNSFNIMISKRRAQTIADLFIAQGISANRIEVKGAGSANPIATNKTEQGRSKNRRVEIKLK